MDTFSCLQISVSDHIAHLQLDRPDKANALNGVLWREIEAAFRWVDSAPEVRVALLSGAGAHFCAGIDFELLQAILQNIDSLAEGRKQEQLRRSILELQDCFTALETCRKPVLAAIHGACIGAALDLIAACDMRYASAEAIFSLREVDLGIVADLGSLQRLPRLIGEGRTRELAFTGRDCGATEALQIGLVNRVFDNPRQLLEEVQALAATIAAKSPLTVRGIKAIMNYSRDHSVASGLNFVATWNAATVLSADTQEALRAALQKRSPQFQD